MVNLWQLLWHAPTIGYSRLNTGGANQLIRSSMFLAARMMRLLDRIAAGRLKVFRRGDRR
jgi:hypothetical protein